jgi:hypothetical protein
MASTSMASRQHNSAKSVRLQERGRLRHLLVILYGSNRGGPPTWQALHRNLLDPTSSGDQSSDLMLVLPKLWIKAMRSAPAARVRGNLGQARRLLLDRAQHVVEVPELQDWGRVFTWMEQRAQHSASAARAPWRHRINQTLCYAGGPVGGIDASHLTCIEGKTGLPAAIGSDAHNGMYMSSAGLGGVYRWFAKQALLTRRLLTQYEWFVLTRTDTFVLCAQPLPPSLPTTLQAPVVHVSEGQLGLETFMDFHGLYDRFLIASPGAILPALTTVERWVVNNTPFVPGATSSHTPLANAEGMLLASLQESNVSIVRMPRRTFLAQHEGGLNNGDKKRWATCGTKGPVSHLLASMRLCDRYCDEFDDASLVCGREHAHGPIRGTAFTWRSATDRSGRNVSEFYCPHRVATAVPWEPSRSSFEPNSWPSPKRRYAAQHLRDRDAHATWLEWLQAATLEGIWGVMKVGMWSVAALPLLAAINVYACEGKGLCHRCI